MSTVDFDLSFINNLEDVPPIQVPPRGRYHLAFTTKVKEVDSKRDNKKITLIEFNFKIMGILEVEEQSDDPPVIGQMFTIATTPEPDRLKWHKEFLLAVFQIAGVKSFADLSKLPNPVQLIAKVSRKYDKERDTYYGSVSEVQAA